MPLSDTAIRKAKPKDKRYKLADEKGLYQLVTPSGGKWWRWKYRLDGKENLLSLGIYTDVSLKVARERRDEARKLLVDYIDPSQQRKAMKTARAGRTANSFEVIAREWFEKFSPGWAPSHSDRHIARFERDIFPWVCGRPIAGITAPVLLSVVRRIECRGALDTAHRALSDCGRIFRYAIATGRAERDPSDDLRGALLLVLGVLFAAVTEPARGGELLRVMDGYQGTFIVVCALRLAPLVFVRPGELR